MEWEEACNKDTALTQFNIRFPKLMEQTILRKYILGCVGVCWGAEEAY